MGSKASTKGMRREYCGLGMDLFLCAFEQWVDLACGGMCSASLWLKVGI